MTSPKNRQPLIIEISALALLFISITVLAPLIHEALHIIALKIIGCSYNFSWSYKIFKGLEGGVQPLCNFKVGHSLFFYASGYLGTLVLGITPLIVSVEEKYYRSKSILLVDMAGAGLLFSLLSSIGAGRDIIILMDLFGLPAVTGHLVNLSIALIGGYLGYRIISNERWK